MPSPRLVPARTRLGQRWLDAPLRYKGVTVIAAFALVLAPPLVVGAIVNARLGEAQAEARATIEEIAELSVLQDSLREAVTTMQEYLTLALVDASMIERYRAAAARIPDELAAVVDGLPGELASPARALQESTGRLLDDLDALTGFGVAGTQAADVSDDPDFFVLNPVLVDAILRSLDSTAATYEAVDAIEGGLGDILDDQRQEVDHLQQLIVSATFASLALALTVAVATIYAVTDGLARRVRGLADNAHRFLRDAPLLPTTASRDEIGTLGVTMFSAGELLNQRRNEAVAATRAKDEFLARVSHELKTPLTAMIGYAQLLEDDPHLSAEHRADAGRIVAAGRHLHGMVEDLLDVRAIEARKLSLDIEPVPLVPAVAEALDLIRSRADERSITFTCDVPPGLLVAADRRRLREIVLTLLSSAVSYHDERGRIDLAATRRADMVHVTVDRAGPGLAPDAPEGPDAPSGRSGAARGDIGAAETGLAPAQQLAEAMGGEIGVESAIGRGATFWVRLPGVPEAAPDRSTVVTATGPPPERSDRAGAGPTPPRARARARQWWLDASLRRKLLSLVLLMALVWTPPMVIGTVLSARLSDARDEAATTSQKLAEVDALQDSVLRSASAIQTYLTLGLDDVSFVDDYRVASAAIPHQLAPLREGLPEDVAGPEGELEDAVGALVDALDFMVDYGAPYRQDADPGDDAVRFAIDDALGAEIVDLVAVTARAYDAIADFEDQLRARLVAERRRVSDLQASMVRATLLSMVAALAVGVTGASLVMAGLARRVAALSANVDHLLRGEPLEPPPASADEIGQLTDMTLYVGDLLDRRREIAESATRAKDDFLSRVSHELEAPLTAMIGLAGTLGQDPDLSPRGRDDAGHIVHAGRQLHGLIEEMLDIKAIEAGRIALTIEALPVHLSAHEAISLVRPRADERAITIEVDCPRDLAVAADRRRLREVLLNLLSNAVKYNHRDGRIELTARRRDASVRISVSDTGPGISPDDRHHLFEPFERLHAASTDVEGSGIGLALTRHVVEAMHGTIGVESTVGRGSTFWVDLPVADSVTPTPTASGPVAHDR